MRIIRKIIVVATVLGASAAYSHPPDSDGHHDNAHYQVEFSSVHSWTNAKTGEVVRGSFLSARVVDGVALVSIERENEPVVVFPLADLFAEDRAEAQRRIDDVKAIHDGLWAQAITQLGRSTQPSAKSTAPAQAAPFNAFAPFVKTRWDERWLFVESDGLPHLPGGKPGTFEYSHLPMVGITAWQQQVPLPQRYVSDNAWRITLLPEIAEKPVSAKEQLFRGAIALAANGVPIFNPIKNDGRTDTFLAGELDEFGGHCGRADDYHYHIAPTHLQKYVGKSAPIAYALDGFAIYGLFDPTAKMGGPNEDDRCPLGGTEKLDELNGHYGSASKNGQNGSSATAGKGLYHYHASKKYPYLNGGMRGRVAVKGDQIDPQPRASSPRAALPPLNGAKITGFKATGKATDPAWSLEYLLSGKKQFVNYRLENGKWIFDFVDSAGAMKTDTYDAASTQRRQGGVEGSQEGKGEGKAAGGRGGRGKGDGGRKPIDAGAGGGDQLPPPSRDETFKKDSTLAQKSASGFSMLSSDVIDGRLSIDCTCDGKSVSPSLSWSEPPAGTKAFAAVMHHLTPDDSTHVYMVVANIPATARELKGGDVIVGAWGSNTVNRQNAYAPPCSQGPGDKSYTVTLYALSAEAKVTTPLTRDALLTAIKDTTLATTELNMKYARVQGGEQQDGERREDAGSSASGVSSGGGGSGSAQNGSQPKKSDRRGQGRPGGREVTAAPKGEAKRGLLARMTAFKTEVPAHDISVILARPTDRSITVSIATATDAESIVEYWPDGSDKKSRTKPSMVKSGAGGAVNVELTGLAPGKEYHYRVGLLRDGAKAPTWGEESRFRTRPPAGTPDGFTFVVQADSHLDQGVEPKVYEQTLANMLVAKPDFMIDLGDTFMTDKRGQDFKSALAQYDAQRYYFSRLAHSSPLFMALGNHDGEKGTSGKGADDIGPWSFANRVTRFPPPLVDGSMYTGATEMKDGVGSNYYAFEWGDAMFVVLDPYWSTTERIRGGGGGGENRGADGGDRGAANVAGQPANDEPLKPVNSSWISTLGRAQYDWLTKTLSNSKAKYRFVFIHHLVGGIGGAESRGGVESAGFFEWGGNNADGTPGFSEHRAGWAMPIHDLLVKHKVSAVFHGHDHLYVSSQRDGVVYQCVPQPGNPRGNTRTAEQYGYASGILHGSPGHVRVRVAKDKAMVEFIRTSLAGEAETNGIGDQDRSRTGEAGNAANASIVHSYSIAPAAAETMLKPMRRP